MIRIQNDSFSASIAPNGAELRFLKNRQTGEEFIWQAAGGIFDAGYTIQLPC